MTVADTLRNEVSITLAGETRTMRATFAAIRAIENDVGESVMGIIDGFARGDVSLTDAVTIIFHGLRGYGDTRLTLEQVGDAVMQEGLSKVCVPVIDFISTAMHGVSVGKPQETEAA